MPIAPLAPQAIRYDDQGTGEALLLIHGHPFDRSMWAPQLSAFGQGGWRVVAPDLRGYGATPLPTGAAGFEAFAQDLARLLDHLQIGRAVVCGLSMGGQIAMDFCRQFPERVRGLALLATFPQAETPAGKQVRNDTADRLLREGLADYADELLPKMLAAQSIASQPDVASHVLGMMRTAHAQGCAAALRARAERLDYQATLAQLDVPSLVVVGDQDAYTTRADADRMHQLLRQSELVWMEGVGHMPNLEAREPFNAALQRLLDRVQAVPSKQAVAQ